MVHEIQGSVFENLSDPNSFQMLQTVNNCVSITYFTHILEFEALGTFFMTKKDS